jgi:hypothetical protein
LPLPARVAGRRRVSSVGGGVLRSTTVQRRRGLPGGAAPGDEVAMSRLLGDGVVRWLVAVPS